MKKHSHKKIRLPFINKKDDNLWKNFMPRCPKCKKIMICPNCDKEKLLPHQIKPIIRNALWDYVVRTKKSSEDFWKEIDETMKKRTGEIK